MMRAIQINDLVRVKFGRGLTWAGKYGIVSEQDEKGSIITAFLNDGNIATGFFIDDDIFTVSTAALNEPPIDGNGKGTGT